MGDNVNTEAADQTVAETVSEKPTEEVKNEGEKEVQDKPEEPCCGQNGDEKQQPSSQAEAAPEDKDLDPMVEEELPEGKRHLHIAVSGCAHGEIENIYRSIAEIERRRQMKFDLLICCGDYQALRNYGDLEHMHVPNKYKSLNTFYKYYAGEVKAPVLTLFVGGNHEAAGYLTELPNGGWVAPNIYYAGFSNVVRFAGLRIGGLSGIYNQAEFNKAHYERPPFGLAEKISSYHTRKLDTWKLSQLRPSDDDLTSNTIDIMLSHDWPAGITQYGDEEGLVRIKPFFKEDIQKGKLGNPATMKLLQELRPRYWLAAHLHVKFAALVPHKAAEDGSRPEPTRFLSLDKPVQYRHFVQAMSLVVDKEAPLELSYDPQWLAVLRSTDQWNVIDKHDLNLPSKVSLDVDRWDYRPTAEEIAAVEKLGDMKVPVVEPFQHTAPPLKGPQDQNPPRGVVPSIYYKNPQTTEFCKWLGISDLNQKLIDKESDGVGTAFYLIDPSDAEKASADETKKDQDFGGADFIVDKDATKKDEESAESHDTAYLENFNAPAVKRPAEGDAEAEGNADAEGEKTLKRRKVDIEEEAAT